MRRPISSTHLGTFARKQHHAGLKRFTRMAFTLKLDFVETPDVSLCIIKSLRNTSLEESISLLSTPLPYLPKPNQQYTVRKPLQSSVEFDSPLRKSIFL